MFTFNTNIPSVPLLTLQIHDIKTKRNKDFSFQFLFHALLSCQKCWFGFHVKKMEMKI